MASGNNDIVKWLQLAPLVAGAAYFDYRLDVSSHEFALLQELQSGRLVPREGADRRTLRANAGHPLEARCIRKKGQHGCRPSKFVGGLNRTRN